MRKQWIPGPTFLLPAHSSAKKEGLGTRLSHLMHNGISHIIMHSYVRIIYISYLPTYVCTARSFISVLLRVGVPVMSHDTVFVHSFSKKKVIVDTISPW